MSPAADGGLLEEEWASFVIGAAKAHGWMVAHFRPARTTRGWRTPVEGHSGSPDLLLARRGVVLLVELKRDTTKPRPDQAAWLAAIGPRHGSVWRPRDREAVLKILKEGRL